MKSWKTVGLLSTIVISSVFTGGYLYGNYSASEAQKDEISWDKYRVVRTPGGMLEVAKLQKQETIARQVAWVCPLGLCNSLPKGKTQISAVVHYTYRIPLTEYWVLEKISDQPIRYRLNVPKLQPQLPVTTDLSTIRVVHDTGILAPSGPDQQKMQTYIQPELEIKANSREYISATQSEAEITIKEFARKWMREHGEDGDSKIPEAAVIDVIFK